MSKPTTDESSVVYSNSYISSSPCLLTRIYSYLLGRVPFIDQSLLFDCRTWLSTLITLLELDLFCLLPLFLLTPRTSLTPVVELECFVFLFVFLFLFPGFTSDPYIGFSGIGVISGDFPLYFIARNTAKAPSRHRTIMTLTTITVVLLPVMLPSPPVKQTQHPLISVTSMVCVLMSARLLGLYF